jgi:hypothetical protein
MIFIGFTAIAVGACTDLWGWGIFVRPILHNGKAVNFGFFI